VHSSPTLTMNKRTKRPHGLSSIQRDPDSWLAETRGTGGVLARLWRQINLDLGVGGNRFEILLTDFIASAKRNIPASRVSRHFTRGNLRRELEKNTMTFKVFMKALRFLKITKVKFAVELTHSNGKVSVHATEVDLGGQQIQEEMVNDTRGSDKDED